MGQKGSAAGRLRTTGAPPADELCLRIGTVAGILWGASARGLIDTRSLIGRRAA
jgi:hypothetical protein